jgi:long-chain acyl-CoA synthetase
MNFSNFADFFIHSIKLYGTRNALFWKENGKYERISGKKLNELVYHLSKSIEIFNLKPGDKAAIISESRFEWVVTDFACIMNRIQTVPIYTTMTQGQMRYILEHSGAKLCFVSTKLITDKIRAVFDELMDLKKIITFNKTGYEPEYVINFEDLIYQTLIRSKGSYSEIDADKYFESCINKISPDDILTIIYTSGTTGNPKGVCLTHKNILTNVESCQKAFNISTEDRFLSFLPLAHSYERTTGYYFAMSVGAEIYYAQSIDTLQTQFIETRPTLVTAVPMLFTRVYNRIIKNVKTYSRRKQLLVNYAFKIAMKSVNNKESMLWKFFDKLVYKKIRERTGDEIKIFISGGSALNPDIGRFFNGIGINVYEGYGMTEASPVISVNRPGRNKIGTVGLPLDGVDVKIAEDGEILVRGKSIMNGYYKDKEETNASIIEGWLHTGDIGELDNEGFLKITDRKKSLVKTEGGKYISLTHVEETIENSEYISQAIAFAGDDKPFVIALIVPNFEELDSYTKKNNIPFSYCGELVSTPEIYKLFESEITKCQQDHAKYERVRKFAIMDHEFTIESGEVTPSLKLKRKVIENKYKDLIISLYKIK